MKMVNTLTGQVFDYDIDAEMEKHLKPYRMEQTEEKLAKYGLRKKSKQVIEELAEIYHEIYMCACRDKVFWVPESNYSIMAESVLKKLGYKKTHVKVDGKRLLAYSWENPTNQLTLKEDNDDNRCSFLSSAYDLLSVEISIREQLEKYVYPVVKKMQEKLSKKTTREKKFSDFETYIPEKIEPDHFASRREFSIFWDEKKGMTHIQLFIDQIKWEDDLRAELEQSY